MTELPQVYMGRFLSERVTRQVRDGVLVPVRMSAGEPVIPLPYELQESAPSLVPGELMLTEQPLAEPAQRASAFLDRLDSLGIERVGGELSDISERHGGLPLAILDYEDILQGDRSLRVVFAGWWEEQTGHPVYEIADDGSEYHHAEVHKQARFERPQPKQEKVNDSRFAADEHIAGWPLSHDDVERWAQGRFWQYAKTMARNPHSYALRLWGDSAMFERVVQHIREHGGVETFGKTEYRYYEISDRKLWTQGNALQTTALINCKFFDPEKQARLAEEQTGKSREELGLNIPRLEDGEDRAERTETPGLFDAEKGGT